MRYFFSLPGPIPGLATGIAGSALTALAVSLLRALPGFPARGCGTTAGAIPLPAITRSANHHLTVAAGTVE
ncbi:MAG: hypothetical protein ACE5FI_12280 [Anaerolineales bacterium]